MVGVGESLKRQNKVFFSFNPLITKIQVLEGKLLLFKIVTFYSEPIIYVT